MTVLTVAAVGAFHEDAFKVVIAGDTHGCRESGTGYSRLSRQIDNLHLRGGLEVDVIDVGVFFPDAGGIDGIGVRLVLGFFLRLLVRCRGVQKVQPFPVIICLIRSPWAAPEPLDIEPVKFFRFCCIAHWLLMLL